MNGESDNTDKFLNGHSSMSVDGEDPTATPRTDHARHLEEVVERVLKNMMGDTTGSGIFTPADMQDGVRLHAEEDMKDLIAAQSRFEQLFNRTRLIYSHRHPEKVLEAKIKDMKKALQRKEAVISRHHQNLSRWHSILQNGIPSPEPVSASDATVVPSGNRAPIVESVSRATTAPRQSPALAADPVRAPATPLVNIASPAASVPPQPQVSYQAPAQLSPPSYPHSTAPPFPQQGNPGQPGMPMYHRQAGPGGQQLRPQGVPTPPYGMTRPGQAMSNVGYQNQPQQPGMGYGTPRPGVSPLSAMLQPGANPMLQQMQQQQQRVPSPSVPSPGAYGQSVSPRMAAQWRQNVPQMMQPGLQPPPYGAEGYSTEDVAGTYQQQMHPGSGGPPGQQ